MMHGLTSKVTAHFVEREISLFLAPQPEVRASAKRLFQVLRELKVPQIDLTIQQVDVYKHVQLDVAPVSAGPSSTKSEHPFAGHPLALHWQQIGELIGGTKIAPKAEPKWLAPPPISAPPIAARSSSVASATRGQLLPKLGNTERADARRGRSASRPRR